jgi:hypothetical protein
VKQKEIKKDSIEKDEKEPKNSILFELRLYLIKL